MANKKKFYDFDEIRAIPILDVCDYLNLRVEKRGRNYWCKVRNENKASVILHTDTNYFYDFGNGEHGNNISLVQYARGGISEGKALQELVNAFHIVPSQSKEDLLSKPMNEWEYKKIGLYGDLATKNLVFPVATATVEELLDMEYAYRMSMNKLKKEEPEVYKQILLAKAIPFVANKKERFYLSIWNHYCFLQMMNRQVMFFDSEKTAEKFAAETKDLEQSERALYKACLGTDIQIPEPHRYDPQRVLSHMLLGKEEVSIGTVYPEYFSEPENAETYAELTISYDEYCTLDVDHIPHSAVLTAGNVKLQFPKTFQAKFPLPESQKVNRRLSDALQAAEERRRQHTTQSKEKIPEPVR